MIALGGMFTLMAKDLRLEWRSRQTIGLVVVLGLLIVTVLALGLRTNTGSSGSAGAAAILWVAYVFSGIICFERTMGVEKEDNALAALVLSPIGPGAVYAAKLLTNLLMLLTLAAIITPAGVMLFGLSLPAAPLGLLSTLVLSLVGFAAVGTLLSAGASSRRSGGLLPLLVLPLVLPLVIASTAQVIALESGRAGPGLAILVGFDVIFVTAGWMVFDSLLDP